MRAGLRSLLQFLLLLLLLLLVPQSQSRAQHGGASWLALPLLLDFQPALLPIDTEQPFHAQIDRFCHAHRLNPQRCSRAIANGIGEVADVNLRCRRADAGGKLPGFLLIKNALIASDKDEQHDSQGVALPTWLQDDSVHIANDLCIFVRQEAEASATEKDCTTSLSISLEESFQWLLSLDPCDVVLSADEQSDIVKVIGRSTETLQPTLAEPSKNVFLDLTQSSRAEDNKDGDHPSTYELHPELNTADPSHSTSSTLSVVEGIPSAEEINKHAELSEGSEDVPRLSFPIMDPVQPSVILNDSHHGGLTNRTFIIPAKTHHPRDIHQELQSRQHSRETDLVEYANALQWAAALALSMVLASIYLLFDLVASGTPQDHGLSETEKAASFPLSSTPKELAKSANKTMGASDRIVNRHIETERCEDDKIERTTLNNPDIDNLGSTNASRFQAEDRNVHPIDTFNIISSDTSADLGEWKASNPLQSFSIADNNQDISKTRIQRTLSRTLSQGEGDISQNATLSHKPSFSRAAMAVLMTRPALVLPITPTSSAPAKPRSLSPLMMSFTTSDSKRPQLRQMMAALRTQRIWHSSSIKSNSSERLGRAQSVDQGNSIFTEVPQAGKAVTTPRLPSRLPKY